MELDIKMKNYNFSLDDFSYFILIQFNGMSVLTI